MKVKLWNVGRGALCSTAALAFLSGCGGNGASQTSSGVMPAMLAKTEAGRSWMLPGAKSVKRLLYLSDAGSDVFVYDYDTFEKVGQLSSLNNAAEQCVDAKGDIWILEDLDSDQGPGDAVEFARGGTKVLHRVKTSGPPVGCSVSPSGDLEITDGLLVKQSGLLGPGEVQVWKNASGKPKGYDAIPDCYYLTSGGYDNKGNLYVTGEAEDQGSAGICDLSAGGKKLVPVKVDQTLTDPLGVMWDGSYVAITNVFFSSGSNSATEILQTTEPGKNALKVVGSTQLADTCEGNEVYLSPPPFIVGKKNTPVNTTQATGISGFNSICGINPSHFEAWTYPAGGDPIRRGNVPDGSGEAVSIAP